MHLEGDREEEAWEGDGGPKVAGCCGVALEGTATHQDRDQDQGGRWRKGSPFAKQLHVRRA